MSYAAYDGMTENYLHTLAAQQDRKKPLWLLHQAHLALQARLEEQAQWPEKARRWWDLLRFCTARQSIALWLRDEPAALQRIQALAHLSRQYTLADILSEALQGQPQEAASVVFSTWGEDDLRYALRDPAAMFNGKDWSGTDLAIEQHNEGFVRVIAQLLFEDIEGWHLEPPPPSEPPQA